MWETNGLLAPSFVCLFQYTSNTLLRPYVQNSEEGSNTYSTPNREWEVLGSFQSGQVLEMDLIMNTNHKVGRKA